VGNDRTKLSLGQPLQQWQAQVETTDSRAQAQPGPVPGGRGSGVGEQQHLIGRSGAQTLGNAVDLHPEHGLHIRGNGQAHPCTSLSAPASHEQPHPDGDEHSDDDNARP